MDVYEKIPIDEGFEHKIEENKCYRENKTFTFNSDAVQNTLVSFLDQWCEYEFDTSLKFAFYTNIEYGKERKTPIYQELKIELPDKAIIEILLNNEATDDIVDLIASVIKKRYLKEKVNMAVS